MAYLFKMQSALPHVYVRHRDPATLVKEFMGRRSVYKDVFGGRHTPEEWLRSVRKYGRWAFVRIVKGEATIHWYAAARISDRQVAHMLGHELGHITGRRLKNKVEEELRADAFGDTVLEVMEMLTIRRRAPKAPRRGRASGRNSRRGSDRATR